MFLWSVLWKQLTLEVVNQFSKALHLHILNKLEKVQYQASLPVIGAFQGTLRESLYRELGLEWLQTRRWYRKMIFFYKILNGLARKYLFDILPVSKNRHCSTRNQSNLELSQFFTKTKSFNNSFPTALRNGPS